MGMFDSKFVLPSNMLQFFCKVPILLRHSGLFCRLDENSSHDGSCLHRGKHMYNKHRRCQQTLAKHPAFPIGSAPNLSVRVIDQN